MRTYMAKWGICLLAGLSLAGCDFKQATLMSPEDRITAAFPVSESAKSARSVLLDQADEAQKKALSAEFERRLRLRALLCAKGYAPSWLTSPDDIRKNINDGACFSSVDSDITRWLSLRRLGLILAKPPLRAVPASPPEFTVADGTIQTARFASKAAVALVVASQDIEVLDMVSGKALLREPRGSATPLALSANGRVFVTGDGSQVKVRESETGTVLLDLPGVRSEQFVLADERTLFFTRNDNRSDMSGLVLADLGSGKEVPVNVVKNGVQQILPVAKSKDQYILLAWRGAYKIEVQRDKAEPEIHLLAEKPLDGISMSSTQNCLTPDESGCYIVNGKGLSIMALDSLTLQTTPFDPFSIQSVVPTGEKDSFFVYGYMPGGDGQRMFVFNTSTQTIATVDKDKLPGARLVYVPSLHKLAQLNDNKIALLTTGLPTSPPVGLSAFLAEALDLANQRKLEAFEKQQAMEAQAAAAIANTPVARAAADAQIEGVGVYQGNTSPSTLRTPEGRKMGAIDVRVRPSARPIVLVLSSYDPVRWNVIVEPGARLSTVLLSSYGASQVVGAGAARVVQIGTTYAYKLGSSEYDALNQDVKKWTGKGMGVFQGRYEGGSFSVGGGS
ncbi:MAG: hypothetical protein EPO09_05195 [Aquabacterium sp.]|uniref:hypothetical protein n=1 Tax=Aquabacterium sp. TaxID=1872578 RepID=UPI0011FB16D2|nr:hypothetical protein [Aquabacterium sp.]TAK96930.1 MAG: hypothetical protein EPO09_05195 [Aquabacterium sp.]